VFVYYFVHIEAPFEEAEAAVLGRIGALASIADESYRSGEALSMNGSGDALVKVVRMEAGEPIRGASETAVPLIWEATGSGILFPRMEADLVVARVGPELTQISFRGSYTPPFGRLGRTLDRTVMHRVAEAVVKRFVDRIALSVAAEMPTAF